MSQSPVYDAYDSNHPQPWWRRQPKATALQLASAALDECRRDQLHHAHLLEEHKAACAMLAEREKRLVKEVARLSQLKNQPKEQEVPSPSTPTNQIS